MKQVTIDGTALAGLPVPTSSARSWGSADFTGESTREASFARSHVRCAFVRAAWRVLQWIRQRRFRRREGWQGRFRRRAGRRQGGRGVKRRPQAGGERGEGG